MVLDRTSIVGQAKKGGGPIVSNFLQRLQTFQVGGSNATRNIVLSTKFESGGNHFFCFVNVSFPCSQESCKAGLFVPKGMEKFLPLVWLRGNDCIHVVLKGGERVVVVGIVVGSLLFGWWGGGVGVTIFGWFWVIKPYNVLLRGLVAWLVAQHCA